MEPLDVDEGNAPPSIRGCRAQVLRVTPDGPVVEIGVDWSPDLTLQGALRPLWSRPVTVLQLTVEQAFGRALPPAWTALLDAAASQGGVVAHGVHASPWTVPRDAMATSWLARTRAVLERWPARWITDHVGCCRAGGWHAAPIPVPPSEALVAVGRDHLRWVRDTLEIPVGLENLALAFSVRDVLAQPDLVDAVVRPVDGLVLLDLHNLWCQATNYGLDPIALLERWPLDLVRQIHVAGGRVSQTADGPFRRDTHDGPVPDEVWDLVPEVVGRCGNLEVAVFERQIAPDAGPEAVRDEVFGLAEAVRQRRRTPAGASLPAPPERPCADPAHVAPRLFDALRRNDVDALEQAWGWGPIDRRAAAVAVEVTARWGRSVPDV